MVWIVEFGEKVWSFQEYLELHCIFNQLHTQDDSASSVTRF